MPTYPTPIFPPNTCLHCPTHPDTCLPASLNLSSQRLPVLPNLQCQMPYPIHHKTLPYTYPLIVKPVGHMFTHLAATCTATHLPNSTQPTLTRADQPHTSPCHMATQLTPTYPTTSLPTLHGLNLRYAYLLQPTCLISHVHTLPQHALPHAYSLLPNLCLYSPTYLATVHPTTNLPAIPSQTYLIYPSHPPYT